MRFLNLAVLLPHPYLPRFSPKQNGDIPQFSNGAHADSMERNFVLYIVALPLMWFLTLWVMAKKGLLRLIGRVPKTNSLLFDGLSPRCRGIKEGAASFRALELIYGYERGEEGLTTDFWLGMRNAQAVRNRFRILKQELMSSARAFAQKTPTREVSVISLASGSAQAVIEVAAELKKEDIHLLVYVLDMDEPALSRAQFLAHQYGVGKQVHTVLGNVFKFKNLLADVAPQIVEMAGFLDYLSDQQAVWVINAIREKLPEGGVFLTCHIHKNPEQSFLKWVIDWDRGMRYRSPKELENLVLQGGFPSVSLLGEPHGIHTIALAKK